jgi:hypothetical protein
VIGWTTIPTGDPICADNPVPDAWDVPPEPKKVETTAAGVILRMVRPARSVTNKSPLEEDAMEDGVENVAAEPSPLEFPLAPVPAKVVVIPDLEIRLILLLY